MHPKSRPLTAEFVIRSNLNPPSNGVRKKSNAVITYVCNGPLTVNEYCTHTIRSENQKCICCVAKITRCKHKTYSFIMLPQFSITHSAVMLKFCTELYIFREYLLAQNIFDKFFSTEKVRYGHWTHQQLCTAVAEQCMASRAQTHSQSRFQLT